MRNLVILLLIGVGWYVYQHGFNFPNTSAEMPHDLPELLQPPVQTTLNPTPVIMLHGYNLSEVASYTITARILSAKHYHLGRETDLSPVDLALGWGLMANRKVYSQLDISQIARTYQWHYDDVPPIELEQIEQGSANTHIIPANDAVRRAVMRLHRNQVVTLRGELVDITAPDGWTWHTSLTRTDTGDGSCEVMMVEEVAIH